MGLFIARDIVLYKGRAAVFRTALGYHILDQSGSCLPMPIYEYVCRKCHHEFETLVRGDEKPNCPKCGDKKLDKLLSVPAAHTAGSSSRLPCGDACGVDRGAAPPCGMGQCGMGQCGMF
jgi:putative FmdB family regulatory protein